MSGEKKGYLVLVRGSYPGKRLSVVEIAQKKAREKTKKIIDYINISGSDINKITKSASGTEIPVYSSCSEEYMEQEKKQIQEKLNTLKARFESREKFEVEKKLSPRLSKEIAEEISKYEKVHKETEERKKAQQKVIESIASNNKNTPSLDRSKWVQIVASLEPLFPKTMKDLLNMLLDNAIDENRIVMALKQHRLQSKSDAFSALQAGDGLNDLEQLTGIYYQYIEESKLADSAPGKDDPFLQLYEKIANRYLSGDDISEKLKSLKDLAEDQVSKLFYNIASETFKDSAQRAEDALRNLGYKNITRRKPPGDTLILEGNDGKHTASITLTLSQIKEEGNVDYQTAISTRIDQRAFQDDSRPWKDKEKEWNKMGRKLADALESEGIEFEGLQENSQFFLGRPSSSGHEKFADLIHVNPASISFADNYFTVAGKRFPFRPDESLNDIAGRVLKNNDNPPAGEVEHGEPLRERE